MTKREARRAGKQCGLDAAAWKFDGNTTDETYRAFLKGYEEGDPAVMDAYGAPNWLSGEWAGESMSELLGECDSIRDENRVDGVADAYCDAADKAYWAELVREARFHTTTQAPKPGEQGFLRWRAQHEG